MKPEQTKSPISEMPLLGQMLAREYFTVLIEESLERTSGFNGDVGRMNNKQRETLSDIGGLMTTVNLYGPRLYNFLREELYPWWNAEPQIQMEISLAQAGIELSVGKPILLSATQHFLDIGGTKEKKTSK